MTCSGSAPNGVVVLASISQNNFGTNAFNLALIAQRPDGPRQTERDLPTNHGRSFLAAASLIATAARLKRRALGVDPVNIQLARLFQTRRMAFLVISLKTTRDCSASSPPIALPQVPCVASAYGQVGCEIDVVGFFSANCFSSGRPSLYRTALHSAHPSCATDQPPIR